MRIFGGSTDDFEGRWSIDDCGVTIVDLISSMHRLCVAARNRQSTIDPRNRKSTLTIVNRPSQSSIDIREICSRQSPFRNRVEIYSRDHVRPTNWVCVFLTFRALYA